MSAIDMFASVDTVKGKNGEKRISITLNGKVSCSKSVTTKFELSPNHLGCNALYPITLNQLLSREALLVIDD